MLNQIKETKKKAQGWQRERRVTRLLEILQSFQLTPAETAEFIRILESSPMGPNDEWPCFTHTQDDAHETLCLGYGFKKTDHRVVSYLRVDKPRGSKYPASHWRHQHDMSGGHAEILEALERF